MTSSQLTRFFIAQKSVYTDRASVVVYTEVTMPVTVELLENERVIYYRITDPFRLSDVRVLQPQIQAIRDQYPHIIHLVLDVTEAHRFPSDILSARHGSPNIHHPRAGLI